ncbi:phosphotransferase [Calothrix rhizosoleniae]|uniref:phosphotransferase n=1 Tax=Calothrix rhizosoleniae TaxID=888997 RepID=UPI000B49DF7D|nr:phosphotransferase [Calothrix rhizosoleniae]
MAFLLSSQNVFEYLINQGVCLPTDKEKSTVELKPAKNFNLLITLPTNNQILIKQERYNREGKTYGEFFNEWRIHDLCRQFTELQKISPYLSEALDFNPQYSIIIFNYLNKYQDLSNFYAQDSTFPHQIATSLGKTIALIHKSTWNRQDYRDFLCNYQGAITEEIPNLTANLERITPEIFSLVPVDGLKFFALYQRYDSLGQAIADLNYNYTACCLTHNDLKLNNILLSLNWQQTTTNLSSFNDSIIRIIDWENSNWGDPASDLGTLIGSYLQIWLQSMITSKTIALEESLRLATIPLEILQPSMAALAIAYLNHFPEILETSPDFLLRVVQFAGLALVETIQSKLQHEKSFGNSGICMLQVAKTLLCRPEKSIATVFGMATLELTHRAIRSE